MQPVPLNEIMDSIRAIRNKARNAGLCAPHPYGCGRTAMTFRDDLSRKEYAISALCQSCQNDFFHTDEA